MKKRRCTRAGHRKTFEYERHYEHRRMDRGLVTVSCARPEVPMCRAVDVKSRKTIAKVARSGAGGAIGDGKIFVMPIEEVVRLSDTVRGMEAVS